MSPSRTARPPRRLLLVAGLTAALGITGIGFGIANSHADESTPTALGPFDTEQECTDYRSAHLPVGDITDISDCFESDGKYYYTDPYAEPSSAFADESPTISVDATDDLADGQSVLVTGSGFSPGGEYQVGEWAQQATPVDSDPEELGVPVRAVRADDAGNISASLTVRKTFPKLNEHFGESADCSNETCTISVVLNAKGSIVESNTVALSFN